MSVHFMEVKPILFCTTVMYCSFLKYLVDSLVVTNLCKLHPELVFAVVTF